MWVVSKKNIIIFYKISCDYQKMQKPGETPPIQESPSSLPAKKGDLPNDSSLNQWKTPPLGGVYFIVWTGRVIARSHSNSLVIDAIKMNMFITKVVCSCIEKVQLLIIWFIIQELHSHTQCKIVWPINELRALIGQWCNRMDLIGWFNRIPLWSHVAMLLSHEFLLLIF